uniref:Uncharacterized protein n=1 Tax=Meloidogyne javanica TaxID=6303 RepID=A0A915LVL7_MELJA
MNDICDKLIHLRDKKEDNKLVEESDFYYRIYSYGVENEEYTVNELLVEKHLHNFNISGEDSRRIAELHLTAITQLIYFCEIDFTATQVQGCSSNVSTIIPTKSQLTISLENMTDKDLIGLTKLRMREVLGDLMLEELEMDQPVLFKIGKLMRF